MNFHWCFWRTLCCWFQLVKFSFSQKDLIWKIWFKKEVLNLSRSWCRLFSKICFMDRKLCSGPWAYGCPGVKWTVKHFPSIHPTSCFFHFALPSLVLWLRQPWMLLIKYSQCNCDWSFKQYGSLKEFKLIVKSNCGAAGCLIEYRMNCDKHAEQKY